MPGYNSKFSRSSTGITQINSNIMNSNSILKQKFKASKLNNLYNGNPKQLSRMYNYKKQHGYGGAKSQCGSCSGVGGYATCCASGSWCCVSCSPSELSLSTYCFSECTPIGQLCAGSTNGSRCLN